jgi:hypothetical protein
MIIVMVKLIYINNFMIIFRNPAAQPRYLIICQN